MLSKSPQRFVAGNMTVGIVNFLKVVQIDKQNRAWCLVTVIKRQLIFQLFIQCLTVQAACKRVGADQLI